MLSRVPAWRQRIADVAVVVGAVAFVAHGWPQSPLPFRAYAWAAFIWGAGFSLMGHYQLGVRPGLSTVAGKLLMDHAILCGAWSGTFFISGGKANLTAILTFGIASLVGLIAVRFRRRRDGSSRSTQFPSALAATDVVLGVVLFYAVNGLWWSLASPPSLIFAIVGGRVFAQGATLLIRHPAIRWVASQAGFIGLLLAIRPAFHWPHAPWQLALGAGLVPSLIIGAHRLQRWRRPPADTAEIWRRLALIAGAMALLHPFFSAQLMGAGDAKLYAEAMQDFLEQIKAEIFPVFVSQTEIAPWGSVFPFRMAFYHFHFGALLDLLTFHSLNVYAVQHLTLVLSGAGGMFALYAVLKRLAPGRSWDCVALVLLYLASPVWLSVFYGLDMYFTAMTLPWLPLAVHAIVRTYEPDCRWRDYLLLGIALAATWLAHPPVGFWMAVVVLLSQLIRLFTARRWPSRGDLGGLSLAVVSCLVLCAGLFVSLADVRIPGELVDPSAQVLGSLRGVIPQVFKPVSTQAERLSDLQLGYAWLLLLLLGLCLRPGPPSRLHSVLLALTTGLLLLIFPVPGITPLLWRSLPWEITNITNVWPMQRLYPIVLTLAAFIAAGSLRQLPAARFGAWRLIFFGGLLIWTGSEAVKFVRRGHLHAKSTEASRLVSRVENSPLLSSWTAYTPQIPPHLLVGRVEDPRLRNRLLDAKDKTELLSNYLFAANPPARETIATNTVRLDVGVQQITPSFVLQPGQRYQLLFHLADYDYGGVLQLFPLRDIHYRFYREVTFPPGKRRGIFTLTVWSSETEPLIVDLLFRPNRPADAENPLPGFLSYELIPYRPASLPIKVTSLAPYTASVDAAQPAFLETHRFFARGYRATVNHRIVPVTESPQHLAMLPLDPGKNEVRLDYVGPPAVVASFWVSLVAWIAVAGYAAWLVVESWLARFPGTLQSTSPSSPAE